jgi:hypothetical protein
MKKPNLTTVTALLGFILGCYIAIVSKRSGLMFALQILSGTAFGHFVGLTLGWRKYGTLIWSFISLTVVTLLDWSVGSSWTIYGKLEFMFAGLFMGLDFWCFRKRIALLGTIGMICGFLLGLNNRIWFGSVRLDPGLLNAALLSVKFSIFGMGIGSVLFEIFDWRPWVDDIK